MEWVYIVGLFVLAAGIVFNLYLYAQLSDKLDKVSNNQDELEGNWNDFLEDFKRVYRSKE